MMVTGMRSAFRGLGPLALVLSVTLACDSTTNPEDDLVGTWAVTDYVITSQADPATSVDLIADGFLDSFEITFAEDGTYSYAVTFSVPGTGQTFTDSGTGTYTVSGTTVDITEEGETSSGTIDGNTISVEEVDDEAWDFDEDGVSEPGTVRLVLTKQ